MNASGNYNNCIVNVPNTASAIMGIIRDNSKSCALYNDYRKSCEALKSRENELKHTGKYTDSFT